MAKKLRMGVDPGTQKIGWAVGPVRSRNDHDRVMVWDSIRSAGTNWLVRSAEILLELDIVLSDHEPEEVIIEMPRSWDTGRGAGAKASGAILKLMFFVGRLADRAQTAGARIGLLGAGIWQGQLPKHLIYSRMDKRYDLDFPSDEKHWDISDAIGLLHYSHELARKIQWIH